MDLTDIAFGICWYDDPSIFRLLDSLPKESKKIVVDGRFKLSEYPYKLSHPSLRKSVLEYDNIRLIDAPDLMEQDKRNTYLKEMKDYDFGIMLDSDEWLVEVDWDMVLEALAELPRQPAMHGIDCYYSGNDVTPYPRIFVMPSSIKHFKTHNIFDVGGNIMRSPNTKPLKGIRMRMNDEMRSDKYLKESSNYQKNMIEYELKYRHALRDGRPMPD
jgi:hypothetical protein